jgi:hypothetical protein
MKPCRIESQWTILWVGTPNTTNGGTNLPDKGAERCKLAEKVQRARYDLEWGELVGAVRKQ